MSNEAKLNQRNSSQDKSACLPSAPVGAESEGYQAAEIFRAIVDQSVVGFAQSDLDGRIIFANDRYCEITGYSRDDVLGKRWMEFTHPDDRQRNAEHFAQMTHSKQPSIFEKRYLRKNGEIIWVSIGPSQIRDAAGQVVGGAAFVVDISEKKRALDKLRASEENLNRAQAVGHIGSWLLDISSNRLEWSAETYRMFGIPSHEPVNLATFFASIHPADRDCVMHAWGEAVARDVPYDIEHRIVVGGETRWVRERAHIERDAEGRAHTGIGTVQDISGNKVLEREIQERRNEMAELQKLHVASQTAAAFAHELNQPLLAIASYSEAALMLLQADKPDLDKIRKAVSESERQAQRAGQSIRKLLEFLSMKEFPTEAFDLQKEILATFDTARQEYELQFHSVLRHEHEISLIRANRTHLQKALLNLLHNGTEAALEAGESLPSIIVTLRALSDEGIVQVTIQDNGPGFEQQDFKRLFEPFFTTRAKGIGMGLAVSRALIESNGGRLWADTQQGQGAIFHLTLPFAT